MAPRVRKNSIRLPKHVSSRADLRRLCDLLLVGNGGALLLIFNARLLEKVSSADARLLKVVGAIFAIGLLGAVLMAVQSFFYDQVAETSLRPNETQEKRDREQELKINLTSTGFLMSLVAFLIGLTVAISNLSVRSSAGTDAAEKPTVAASPPSPDAEAESSSRP